MSKLQLRLLYYNLPDGITGERDIILLKDIPKICPKCKYTTFDHIYTKSFRDYGLLSELTSITINSYKFCAVIGILTENVTARNLLHNIYTNNCRALSINLAPEREINLLNNVSTISATAVKMLDKIKNEYTNQLKHYKDSIFSTDNMVSNLSKKSNDISKLEGIIGDLSKKHKDGSIYILRPIYVRNELFVVDKCNCE